MPHSLSSTPRRDHSLDAARGILMMLGVVLHASNVYLSGGGWLLSDPQRGQWFDDISASIHVFRMPAFFWISGWFCAQTFASTGPHALLRRRVPRLLIPLVVCMFSLNLIQEAVVAMHEGATSLAVWRDGVAIYHLWFLVDLLVFVVLAAALLPLMTRRIDSDLAQRAAPPHWSLLVLGLGTASAFLGLLPRATGLAYASPYGLTSLHRLFSYAPFFFGGALMYFRPAYRRALCATPPLLLLVSIPTAVAIKPWQKGPDAFSAELATLAGFVLVWACVGALLNLFKRTMAEESPVTRLSNEISYTVYLFHHVIVVLLALALFDKPWGAAPKFMLLIAASLAITGLIHLLVVRRHWLLSLAFNGRAPTPMPDGFLAWLRGGSSSSRTSSANAT